jgi:hypothetical protein
MHGRTGDRPPQKAGGARPQWVSAVAAGVVAGLAFIVLQAVLGSMVYGESVWAPFHRIAAMAIGTHALDEPEALDADIVLVALSVHAGLSALYGLVLSYLIVEFRRASAWLLGSVAGVLIYLVNFYGFTGLFPWMAEMRGALTLLTHAVFGALLAACYWAFTDRPASKTLASG